MIAGATPGERPALPESEIVKPVEPVHMPSKTRDPADPTGKKRWETFTYELACAELCGSSHFAMRRPVRVVSDAEYNVWVKSQKSYYMENVRGKDFDPNKGKTISIDPAPSTAPTPEVKSDSTGANKTDIKKDGVDTSLKKIK